VPFGHFHHHRGLHLLPQRCLPLSSANSIPRCLLATLFHLQFGMLLAQMSTFHSPRPDDHKRGTTEEPNKIQDKMCTRTRQNPRQDVHKKLFDYPR
jgi:hypothetical protein